MSETFFALDRSASQTEVHHDRLAPLIDHDIGRFQIPVNDIVVMSFRHRQRDLADDSRDLLVFQSLRAFREITQWPALDIGHGDVMLTVDFTDIMHRTDARMPQRRCRSSFPIETFEHGFADLTTKLRNLQRDFPVKLLVMSQIDRAHRSAPEFFQNAITTELRQR